MTLFLFVSNFELSKQLSVFVPLWLNGYPETRPGQAKNAFN